MSMLQEEIASRLDEARRVAETAPRPRQEGMTLLDAAILLYRADQHLAGWRATLLEARRQGTLTQKAVKRFNMAEAGAYRLKLQIYVTVLDRAASVLPLLRSQDLARVLPAPEVPLPLLTSPELRLLPMGNPGVPAAVAALGAVPAIVWVIAALLLLGLGIGATYIIATKAAEVAHYEEQVRGEAEAARARLHAIGQCVASGNTLEACTRMASEAVPGAPTPPPPRDTIKDLEKAGTYLVWGLVAVAGLSILPVVVGAFQSLRGIAPKSEPAPAPDPSVYTGP